MAIMLLRITWRTFGACGQNWKGFAFLFDLFKEYNLTKAKMLLLYYINSKAVDGKVHYNDELDKKVTWE